MRKPEKKFSYEWRSVVQLWLLAVWASFALTTTAVAQHSNAHESGGPAMGHAGHSVAPEPEKVAEEPVLKNVEMKKGAMTEHVNHGTEAATDSGLKGHVEHPSAPLAETITESVPQPSEKKPNEESRLNDSSPRAGEKDYSGHAGHVDKRKEGTTPDRSPISSETKSKAEAHKEHSSEGAMSVNQSQHPGRSDATGKKEGANQPPTNRKQLTQDHPKAEPDSGSQMDHSAHEGSAGGGLRQITLSPYAQKLAEVRVAPVQRKDVKVEIRMVGKIDYDETRLGYITAWVPGRLDRLYVDFTGTTVKKGDPLVSLYSPELLTAQAELLQAREAVNDLKKTRIESILKTARQTVTAASEKLRLWGFSKDQIDAVIQRGAPSDHMTVLAPMGGVVINKNAFEGMYVQIGTRIYTIADLSTIWVKLDAYESDVNWIRLGQAVDFEVESYPGQWFQGKVAFVDPILDEKTRTVKVRVEATNPYDRLKPGMFVRAVLRVPLSAHGHVLEAPETDRPLPLVIPDSAPLVTGKRAVVYVQVPGEPGQYEGREIVLGERAGGYYLVRAGLHEGELVVVNGAFRIDSALQIEAKPSMMTPEGGGGGGGHHHGGESPKKAETSSMTKMGVPTPFAEQVKMLLAGYEQIAEFLQQESLSRIHSAFHQFATLQDRVDGSLLSGHASMVWREMAMLLRNDSIVGMDAHTMAEAREAFKAMKDHIERLQQQFDFSLISVEEKGSHEHGS